LQSCLNDIFDKVNNVTFCQLSKVIINIRVASVFMSKMIAGHTHSVECNNTETHHLNKHLPDELTQLLLDS